MVLQEYSRVIGSVFDLLFDGFYSDLGVLWEENKHLICGVVVMGHQNREVRPIRSTFTEH